MSERISDDFQGEKQVNYGSNKFRYHEVFGGRRPCWLRCSETKPAYETREILIKIATEARKAGRPGTFKEISQDTGVINPTQISDAARGLLNNRPLVRYDGESLRDFILKTLQNYYQENYSSEALK